MTIKVGDRLPDTTFMAMGPDGAPKLNQDGRGVRRQEGGAVRRARA